ncbi:MAG: carboxylating nicotinate-nucleotide diphosphorylase [Verrucomicrobiae bacterium]|nr:carboxylating nicotinate-nucleotide diphosphorylase [Verrucomicrobiae bacterium]
MFHLVRSVRELETKKHARARLDQARPLSEKTDVPLSPRTRALIRDALDEDVGRGDRTSQAVLPPGRKLGAFVAAKAPGILCGLEIAAAVFKTAPGVKVKVLSRDGSALVPGTRVLSIEGAGGAILTRERMALNFLQRLSGIATLTSHYVERLQGLPCRVLDTRKTTPGWRELEKYAVACGGGTNHRRGLDDMILIKDNHLVALAEFENPIGEAVRRARRRFPRLKVEVECDTLEQVALALRAKPDFILLDNMDVETLRAAVKAARSAKSKAKLEASGNVTLDSLRAIAETGVDFISVGALTHSAPGLDLSLEAAWAK